MIVRELTTFEEFEACLDLQREGFGWQDVELMPNRFFVVSRHIGGLVLGAFEQDKLIGFSSAIPGSRDGAPYWHSHMLAVTEAFRNTGVGLSLKLAQKAEALKRGIHLIEWTFEPTRSRNAYFNIEKLGVIVRRYYPNMYGMAGRPALHGIESDRVIAEWRLNRPRPAIEGDVRRVTIPLDSSVLRRDDPAAARETQLRVRRAFQDLLRVDYFAVAFERRADSGDYVFIRGASRADRAG